MAEQAKHVAVIGAGAVGVASALYLLREGYSVTVIDRQGPGEGASFGNGSVIGEESVVPVGMPGIQKRVPRMLLDPAGPLTVRLSYLPRLAPWLSAFLQASRADRVERIAAALATLMDGAMADFDPLLEMAGEPQMIRKTGWLCVYESEEGFIRDGYSHDLQRRNGVAMQVVEKEELRQLEPALAPIFEKGIYYPDVGYALDNYRLVTLLAETFVKAGGTMKRAEVRDFERGPEGVRAVLTDAGRIDCDAVVVAAGAWSKPLAAKLGAKVLLDTERGYHMQYPNPGVAPRMPVYSTERAFVATPLENGLRVAGTVEMGGLDLPPNWKRAKVLERHVSRWYPELNTEGGEPWMGHRPSMPDSKPVIAPSPEVANAYLAFGHGHCGLMLAARTGRLVAEMVGGRPTVVDLSPFRADRF